MKNTSFISLFLVLMSCSAFAGEGDLVKTCSTDLVIPGNSSAIDTKIEIFKKGDSFKALVTQVLDDEKASSEDVVRVAEYKVQDGMRPNTDDIASNLDGLNLAESLIVQAMTMAQDPEMAGNTGAGLDLTKVKSAKVYTVGKRTHTLHTAIVEAKDESGKALGSFFSGFTVTPCK